MKKFFVLFLVLVFFAAIACTSSGGRDEQRATATPAPEDEGDDDSFNFGDGDGAGYPRCPGREDMLLIPAGEFVYRNEGERFEAEGALEEVRDTDVFCIDEFEYPNIAGGYPTPVNWNEAGELCGALGKRLCTATEWQKACTGPANLVYPWGDEFVDDVCNTHKVEWEERELAPSGEWTECVTDYGVYDMAGNLSEWTDDVWQEGWSDRTLQGGGSNINTINSQELLDDGFWQFIGYSQRCSSMHHHQPDVGMDDDGTRCCAEP